MLRVPEVGAVRCSLSPHPAALRQHQVPVSELNATVEGPASIPNDVGVAMVGMLTRMGWGWAGVPGAQGAVNQDTG